jgi:hypothetical protein
MPHHLVAKDRWQMRPRISVEILHAIVFNAKPMDKAMSWGSRDSIPQWLRHPVASAVATLPYHPHLPRQPR